MVADKHHTLFGGSKGWNTSDWTASDDRVRGGKSVSHVTLPTSETLLFWGNLDYSTLGSAGFASQHTTCIPRLGWDLSDSEGIMLELEAESGKLNDKKFTFIVKDTVLPKRPDGRERSSINWEFDFDVPRVNTGSTVWYDAQAETRDKEESVKDEDEQADPDFEHIETRDFADEPKEDERAAEEGVLLDADFYVHPEDAVTSVSPAAAAAAVPFGEKQIVKVCIPWGMFQPTYRGRKRRNASDLDTKHIRQISLMVRSFFGEQSGDFALTIRSISTYVYKKIDVEAQRPKAPPPPQQPESAIQKWSVRGIALVAVVYVVCRLFLGH